MIIYGTGAAHVHSEKLKHIPCPSCETEGSLVLSIHRRHAHIFWIPLFPIGKRGVVQCQHCGYARSTKDSTGPIHKEYENLKDVSRGPLWQFAGLGVLAILIALIAYVANGIDQRNLKYIEAPKEGDVYEYRIESGHYSTMKVIEVSDDSVFVLFNEYEMNRSNKLREIDLPKNYSDTVYGLSREQLKELYDEGDIMDVNR